MLIDTHFHLDHFRNHFEIYKEINNLKQKTLCVTNTPYIYNAIKQLYKETKYIKFAIGFHPMETINSAMFEAFKQHLDKSRYIGEIGLDYSKYSTTPREKQLYYFERIVKICSKLNKVMSIHSRNAESDVVDIVERYKPKRAIIHWYTGNEINLERLISLGCYFSVNSSMMKDKYQMIPINRVLIETDAPYEIKNYRPERLIEVYNKIEKFYQIPNLELVVENNFQDLIS